MIKPCRVCGFSFEPSSWKVNRGNWICTPCLSAHERERRAKRKAEGRPIVSGKMPREYHRSYAASYKERPGVRERVAERARIRSTLPEEKFKNSARRKLRSAVAAGRIQRQPCKVCGDIRTEAHHTDYDRPFDVTWLCSIHHRAEHNRKARGEQP